MSPSVYGLDVHVRTTRGCTVVALSGNLDVYSQGALRNELDDLDATRMVLDLSGLDFCDSSGLGVMIGQHKRTRNAGGGLVLAGVGQNLARVLRITGLARVLTTATDVDEACHLLGP